MQIRSADCLIFITMVSRSIKFCITEGNRVSLWNTNNMGHASVCMHDFGMVEESRK